MPKGHTTKTISTGICHFCHKELAKSGMTRHLQACKERKIQQKAELEGKETHKETVYHLVVEDRYRPSYWMHLELPASAMLDDLDAFLRDIWLECCGHLSGFEIGGDSYASHLENDRDIDEIKAEKKEAEEQYKKSIIERYEKNIFSQLPPEQVQFAREELEKSLAWSERPVRGEYGMNVSLHKLFKPDMKIAYTYDYGSSTDLTIRVLSPYETEIAEPKIRVLARNIAPVFSCEKCGKPATQIASDDYGNSVVLCDGCWKKSKRSYEYALPLVNSPRVGVCAYSGGPDTDIKEWVIG